MIDRPCKPDADLKGLWRTLLGMPFPACGISADSEEGQIAEIAGSKDRGVKEFAGLADNDDV